MDKRIRKVLLNRLSFFIIVIFLICLLVVLNQYGYISISEGYTSNWFFYIVCSMAGWLIIYLIANILSDTGYVSRLLISVRNHSVIIVALHFVSFKMVSLFYILLKDGCMLQLACFPVIHTN